MSPLPEGSLVLVSGCNGFIASHIVDQLLLAGYRVRGTVREQSKADWLKEYVAKTYNASDFEVAVVPDQGVTGAFDAAVKGASAFIHTTSDLSFRDDPNEVIPANTKGAIGALESASKEEGLNHFVYTSSAAAVAFPPPDTEFEVNEDTWNEESVQLAWNYEPGAFTRALHVYAASKVEAEKAVLNYTTERNPHFGINTVIPNGNFGPLFDPANQMRSSGALIPELYLRGWDGLGIFKDLPPQYHIDVRDTARLHIAPLIDPSILNERIFAFSEPYHWNGVLDIMKKLRPNHRFVENSNDSRRNLMKIGPRERTNEILRKNFGGRGLISLEESIEANIAHLK